MTPRFDSIYCPSTNFRPFPYPSEGVLRTRAVVVVHDGEIVAERYGEGFDENSRLTGWSMTKSILSTLIGRAFCAFPWIIVNNCSLCLVEALTLRWFGLTFTPVGNGGGRVAGFI